MTGPAHSVDFSISRLTAWAPGVSTDAEWEEWVRGTRMMEHHGEPRLQQMPAILRRHAGRLGRMMCDVAYRVLDGETGVPMVMSSRYGEVGRSVDLLTALARGTELSPTSFGLSVHNAVGGLFGMARHDRANCIALAGGDESAEYGFVESCGLLSDGAERVLLVIADCPLPDVYEAYADVEPAAFAWGCLVERAHGNAISLARAASPMPFNEAKPPAALAALRFLLDDSTELSHHAHGHRWLWRRHA